MDRKSQIEFLIKFLGVEYDEEFALQYEYEEYPGLQATYYIDKEEGLKYKEPCNYIYALAEGGGVIRGCVGWCYYSTQAISCST